MKEGEKAVIIVATHKPYRMPEDELYLPLHVGAEGKVDKNGNPLDFGFAKDNTGDNISALNPGFSELTGLYWGWKNLDADYIGLAHYRRHFGLRNGDDVWKRVLTYEDLQPYLGKVRIFVPTKRCYYIETLYTHYEHTHYSNQLDETRTIISDMYPEYLDTYDKVLNQDSGYMFNMMIMERNLLDEYCTWLFNILFELRGRIDQPNLSSYQGRFYGRVSEIIFNVWLEYQLTTGRVARDEVMELTCLPMEKENWIHKGTAFLLAKYFGIKYKGSF